MTTPPPASDPFATPSGSATPPPPGAEFAPAASPLPPAYSPIAVTKDNSLSKIGLWAIVLTGLVALATIGSAFNAPAVVEATKEAAVNPENADPFAQVDAFGLLAYPAWIASFVLLALWMNRVRGAMVARGERVAGPGAVEWWGWFVPLAWYVLPFLGMRAITKGKTSLGIVVAWWVAFCTYWTVVWSPFFVIMGAFDWTTGELVRPDAYDVLIPVSWISAIALLISWVFLALTIRSTTAAEKAK